MVAGQQPWQVLSALPAWQLTQVPRSARRRDDEHADDSGSGDGTRGGPRNWYRRGAGPPRSPSHGCGNGLAARSGDHTMIPSRQAAAAMPPSAEARWPTPQPSVLFYGSTALVAALARVPAREVPGLRMVTRPQFDLTPETPTGTGLPGAAAGMIRVGEVLDSNRVPCGDLAVPRASLNRYVFVCGATGSGKSQTVRNLLEQATGAGIPWLVIGPPRRSTG